MNKDLELDATDVLSMYSEFDLKKRKQVYRTATRNALNIVKKQTLQNLKGVINPSMINKKDKWGNSFRNGITIKIYKSGKGGVIHIMKNFKMKFFELGTEKRYRKVKGLSKVRKFFRKDAKGGYTGQIKKYSFFSKAKEQKESEVFNSINRLISTSIKKINDKYSKGK